MITLFSTNNPNRIAVQIAAFIRTHDPIRRWAFGKYGRELFPNAPHWIVILYDDFVTAVVRDAYERGIATALREAFEGMYNVTFGAVCMIAAKALNPSYRELKYGFEWREEQRQKQAAQLAAMLADDPELAAELAELAEARKRWFAKHPTGYPTNKEANLAIGRAEPKAKHKPMETELKAAIEVSAALTCLSADTGDPAKLYTLDVLMWKLWCAVPEADRRTVFAAMFNRAWPCVDEQTRPIIDVYHCIADHLLGDTASMDDSLYDRWPNTPQGIECARAELNRWRKGGAGWLADIYQPQVDERAAALGTDDLPKAA